MRSQIALTATLAFTAFAAGEPLTLRSITPGAPSPDLSAPQIDLTAGAGSVTVDTGVSAMGSTSDTLVLDLIGDDGELILESNEPLPAPALAKTNYDIAQIGGFEYIQSDLGQTPIKLDTPDPRSVNGAVPIPSAALLGVAGLAGLASIRSRRTL